MFLIVIMKFLLKKNTGTASEFCLYDISRFVRDLLCRLAAFKYECHRLYSPTNYSSAGVAVKLRFHLVVSHAVLFSLGDVCLCVFAIVFMDVLFSYYQLLIKCISIYRNRLSPVYLERKNNKIVKCIYTRTKIGKQSSTKNHIYTFASRL